MRVFFFPGDFQAQEAPRGTFRVDGHGIPEDGGAFAFRFHFRHFRPGLKVFRGFHQVPDSRGLLIDGPGQHQEGAAVRFFRGDLHDVSAGLERVQSRSVFQQVGDAVSGGRISGACLVRIRVPGGDFILLPFVPGALLTALDHGCGADGSEGGKGKLRRAGACCGIGRCGNGHGSVARLRALRSGDVQPVRRFGYVPRNVTGDGENGCSPVFGKNEDGRGKGERRLPAGLDDGHDGRLDAGNGDGDGSRAFSRSFPAVHAVGDRAVSGA